MQLLDCLVRRETAERVDVLHAQRPDAMRQPPEPGVAWLDELGGEDVTDAIAALSQALLAVRIGRDQCAALDAQQDALALAHGRLAFNNSRSFCRYVSRISRSSSRVHLCVRLSCSSASTASRPIRWIRLAR